MFFKQWRMDRYMKKELKRRQKAEKIKQIAVYKHLQELYGFVQHLNKNILPNRRARKSFWARVKSGEPLLEKTMALLIEKYKPAEKRKKVKTSKEKILNKGASVESPTDPNKKNPFVSKISKKEKPSVQAEPDKVKLGEK